LLSPAPKTPRSKAWLPWLAFLAPALFALSTNNIWEDFFITYRCSLNLVHGHGLVYEAGRAVHAFTSPLGTLFPAGISWVIGSDDPQRVIDIFRLCGCAMLALAWRLVASRSEQPAAMAIVAGLWLFDCKLAAFSTNGMETAFLVFFVVLAWRALVDGDFRMAGVALGGALWTRPDGFVFIGSLMVATWLVQPGWRVEWKGWVQVVVWGALIYAPWFGWAWWYYGSPVPNTIIAKSSLLVEASGHLRQLLTYPGRLLFGRTVADDSFLPPYFYFGGWPGFLRVWSKGITLAVILSAIWRGGPRPARIAGWAFLLGGFYLELIPQAPWYFPAWQALAYVAIGGLAANLLVREKARWPRIQTCVAGGFFAALIIVQGFLFVAVSTQLREQHRVIEVGLRTTLGQDLHTLAGGPHDTVFLEPLGYIGYFSGLSMRDTPGLCAPEVVALRRAGTTRMAALAASLSTDWVVLRRGELDGMTVEERAAFDRHYQFVREYNAAPQVHAINWLPGRNYLYYDSCFTLWHLQSGR
jgi:hypothetical protein